MCKPHVDGAGSVSIQGDAFAAECDDAPSENASLDDPQFHAPRQSDLTQTEPVPVIQIDVVHNNAHAARTITQRHDGILSFRPRPSRIVVPTSMRNIHGLHT